MLDNDDTLSVKTPQHAFIKSVPGVRYQVKDVGRAVTFYTAARQSVNGRPNEFQFVPSVSSFDWISADGLRARETTAKVTGADLVEFGVQI